MLFYFEVAFDWQSLNNFHRLVSQIIGVKKNEKIGGCCLSGRISNKRFVRSLSNFVRGRRNNCDISFPILGGITSNLGGRGVVSPPHPYLQILTIHFDQILGFDVECHCAIDQKIKKNCVDQFLRKWQKTQFSRCDFRVASVSHQALPSTVLRHNYVENLVFSRFCCYQPVRCWSYCRNCAQSG